MRYVIAGGGAYGAHYVRKLLGGIPFTTICAETDRVCRAAEEGAEEIGVATFSSCHGVLTRLKVKQPALVQ